MPYPILEGLFLDLQLFSEEGAEMAGAESTDAEFAAGTGEGEETAGVATQGEGAQQEPAATGDESWESLIKGKYKKEYSNAVQNAVNKRFRHHQNLQAQISAIDPIVREMAAKYGVQPDQNGNIPIDQLMQKYNDDSSRYEEEAFERGMSVDTLKLIKSQERELAQLRNQQQQTERDREWSQIQQQANDLKQMYPNMDLNEEMQNPTFGRLLATFQNAGFPNAVQTAYEAVHREEIMSGAMQYAVQRTAQQVSNSIQSGIRRPAENGTRSQSAAAVGSIDPSKLSLDQIHDYMRRARNGERISF